VCPPNVICRALPFTSTEGGDLSRPLTVNLKYGYGDLRVGLRRCQPRGHSGGQCIAFHRWASVDDIWWKGRNGGGLRSLLRGRDVDYRIDGAFASATAIHRGRRQGQWGAIVQIWNEDGRYLPIRTPYIPSANAGSIGCADALDWYAGDKQIGVSILSHPALRIRAPKLVHEFSWKNPPRVTIRCTR